MLQLLRQVRHAKGKEDWKLQERGFKTKVAAKMILKSLEHRNDQSLGKNTRRITIYTCTYSL